MTTTRPKRERRIPLSVRAYGLWLRGLGRVSPNRADRALGQRFCTPARRRVRPAPELYDRATSVRHEGRRLPLWMAGGGPRVLLAHGWDSNGAFWDPLARSLVEAGMEVVTFDMPAHGSAEGRRTNAFDMAAAVRVVAAKAGTLAAIVGHSAGATAAALALRDGVSAGRAVLIAPPALPASFMFPLVDALGLRHARGLAALRSMQREIGLDPFDADTVEAVAALRIPGLVVHDHDDGRAPWDEGHAIADAWDGARFLSTSGLGHYRLAFDPDVIRAVTRFVREPVAVPQARARGGR